MAPEPESVPKVSPHPPAQPRRVPPQPRRSTPCAPQPAQNPSVTGDCRSRNITHGNHLAPGLHTTRHGQLGLRYTRRRTMKKWSSTQRRHQNHCTPSQNYTLHAISQGHQKWTCTAEACSQSAPRRVRHRQDQVKESAGIRSRYLPPSHPHHRHKNASPGERELCPCTRTMSPRSPAYRTATAVNQNPQRPRCLPSWLPLMLQFQRAQALQSHLCSTRVQVAVSYSGSTSLGNVMVFGHRTVVRTPTWQLSPGLGPHSGGR